MAMDDGRRTDGRTDVGGGAGGCGGGGDNPRHCRPLRPPPLSSQRASSRSVRVIRSDQNQRWGGWCSGGTGVGRWVARGGGTRALFRPKLPFTAPEATIPSNTVRQIVFVPPGVRGGGGPTNISLSVFVVQCAQSRHNVCLGEHCHLLTVRSRRRRRRLRFQPVYV